MGALNLAIDVALRNVSEVEHNYTHFFKPKVSVTNITCRINEVEMKNCKCSAIDQTFTNMLIW